MTAAWLPPLERPAAGEHLVEHDAQREDVGAFVGPRPSSCSGAMYCNCPDDRPGVRQRLAGEPGRVAGDGLALTLRQAEVEQLDAARASA